MISHSIRAICLILACGLAESLWAQDQDTSPDDLTTTTEETSDDAGNHIGAFDAASDQVDLHTFQTPEITPPPAHLLGDWLGYRTRMENSGTTPSVTWVTNMAGNPVGGRTQGFTECDNLGIDFKSDLEKIAGIENAKLHVSMSQRSGASLSNEYIGNAFNVQQVFGGETFKLVDLEYIQRWCDNRISFHGGRIAAGDDFLASPYYWFFMSNGIDGNPVGIFKNAPGMTAYPNATWGTRLRVRPTEHSYLMAGIYNGDATIRDNGDHGVNFTMRGPAFLIAEAGCQINAKPEGDGRIGTYKAGAYYDGNTFESNYQTVLGDEAYLYGVNSESRRGNSGYYFTADQIFWVIDKTAKRGVGAFAALIVSPNEDYSTMPFFCNGGILCQGPFVSRPTDMAGFAMIYGNFSDSLRSAQRIAQTLDPTVQVQGGELVFEWSYRFRMKDGAVYVQPDLQYVVHPNGCGNIPNAFVVGMQLGANF